MGKLKSFTDLDAWKEGHKLVLVVYEVTKDFPKNEAYALVDQMRRAVVSVTSNLAEGFHRQTTKEKIQFCYMALGSLTELQNQLLISKDVGYLDKKNFAALADLSVRVRKLIGGMLRYLKKEKG